MQSWARTAESPHSRATATALRASCRRRAPGRVKHLARKVGQKLRPQNVFVFVLEAGDRFLYNLIKG